LREAVIVRLDRTIQYAAASRFHHECLGLLDHPLSRVMTTEGVARAGAVIASSEATKQSIVTVALAVDCFADPVIGRAFARPAGSQ
jgi:hypothetical protein